MNRSELKNEIESSIRMTCESWGEPYLMVDEQAAFEAMAEAFEGTDSDYENQRNRERGGTDITIYELSGDFYAVSGENTPIYINCDNPAKCEDGLLAMHGSWQDFDDETD